MGRAIIVTGTPGTGKTAFSTRLARQIGANYISLNKYASQHRLLGGYDRKRKSRIVDVEKTRTSLQHLLARTKTLSVIDTHVPDGIVPKRMAQLILVLRSHPRVLETRLRKKRWPLTKIRENVLAEILDACFLASVRYYGRKKIVQLDTSRNSIGRCVVLARKVLEKPPKMTQVDWIAKLEKERLLDMYLK